MLLEVQNVSKAYPQAGSGLFSRRKQAIVNNVTFSIKAGDCVALVGESGSGKSTLARLIGGLEKPDSGRILLNGASVFDRKHRRNRVSIVFQDYTSSVNPAMTVYDVLSEPLLLMENCDRATLNHRISALLTQVGLSMAFAWRYPHELSGGQVQRVCIGRAIATHPQFLILDEAISALDVSTQVQILDLLASLREQFNLSYLFITHDIQAVTYLCNHVLFFYDGQIIERCDVNDLSMVKHPYATQLINAVFSLAEN